jgi:DnaA family protein
MLWLLDDVDQLDAARQEAAFHLFNTVLTRSDTVFVACGDRPPAALSVMPELASRLAWGLVFELRPLSDAETAQALSESLATRGVTASADLVPWLMTHAPRHLGRLRALIDALDVYALSRKRALTLPLLREFVRQAGAPNLP